VTELIFGEMSAGAFDSLADIGAHTISFGDFGAVVRAPGIPLAFCCQRTALLQEIVRRRTIEAN
jgi:hypothetical protein